MSVAKFFPCSLIGKLCWELRESGERIVFTNGCFDIIHAAHVSLLTYARTLGTKLVVGLNSDDSITRLKGAGRPIFNVDARLTVISGLESVSLVTVFFEDTPEDLIRTIKPDVLVKGGDYWTDNIVGAEFVKSCGGRVVVYPRIAGYSTSGILSCKDKK